MIILTYTALTSFLFSYMLTSDLEGPGDFLVSVRWLLRKIGFSKALACKYCIGFYTSAVSAPLAEYVLTGSVTLLSVLVGLSAWGAVCLVWLILDYAGTYIEAFYDFVYLPYHQDAHDEGKAQEDEELE